MATITPYLAAKTSAGSNWSIWYQIVAFFNVGSATCEAIDDYTVKYDGNISLLNIGPFSMYLQLLDRNAGAASGPAVLVFNGAQADSATYEVQGNALYVSALFAGQHQGVKVQRGDGGAGPGTETFLALDGLHGGSIHLAPSA